MNCGDIKHLKGRKYERAKKIGIFRLLKLYMLFKSCTMGRKFRLGLHRKYAAEYSNGGAVSLVVSLPRQGLVIHASSGLSVVSQTACPSTSRTTDCNSSELLNAIVSYHLFAFTCSTLLTSQHLGACLLKITLSLPWVIASINPLTLCSMIINGAGWEEKSTVLTSWAWLFTCGCASAVCHKPQHGWNSSNQHKRRTCRRPRH